ncbi:DoxX family protein [Myceligenerans halotolerans]
MSLLPDPVWPVVLLAVAQAVDAAICVKPRDWPVGQCLRGVNFPEHWWWVLPWIKAAAALGLVAGIWVPGLGAVTAVALVVYFVLALGFHVRARDFGIFFASAVGMFVLCSAVLWWSFLA